MPGTRYAGRAAPPEVCTIETTRFCNLRCRMCIQFLTGSTVAGPHMELAAFEEIAEKVFPHVARWQPSVSGEPLMTKGFARMLELAAERGVQLDLTTNGTLWNDTLRDAVARSLALVQFSFDSHDPETFESIRRGAKFADVVACIRALRARCAELRGDDMPRIGLSVTLMRSNIDHLPGLVEFAATELGVDHMQVLHVYAIRDDVRQESLVHDVERARRSIAAAAELAREKGIELLVHPLDEVTTLAATESVVRRHVARRADAATIGRTHTAAAASPSRSASARSRVVRPVVPVSPDQPKRIGYCTFLWDRTYVNIGGEVAPCCVPGAPIVGSIWNGSLDDVWNGPLYRELRERVVARDPAPVCRGCRGYREIDDPELIARILDGAQPPRPDELGPVSPALDPRVEQVHVPRSDDPPRVRWSEPVDPSAAVLEFSTDHFVTLLFSTAWWEVPVDSDGWQIPGQLWQRAPGDRTIFWRLVTRGGSSTAQLASGRIAPRSTGPTTAGRHPRTAAC